jgi:hypothetical protein
MVSTMGRKQDVVSHTPARDELRAGNKLWLW